MGEIAQKLYYRRSGVTVSIKLYNTLDEVGTDYVDFRLNGETTYFPLGDASDFRATGLSIRKGGVTFRALSTGSVELPVGTVAIFETSCPSGWVRESGLDNYYIMGSSTPNQTGGGSHTHNAVIPSGTASTVSPPATGFDSLTSSPVRVSWPVISEGGSSTHNHTFNQTTQTSLSATNTPSFITVIFCRKT